MDPGVLPIQCPLPADNTDQEEYASIVDHRLPSVLGNETTNEDAAARNRIVHSVIQMHINSHDYTAKDLYQMLLSNIKKKVNIPVFYDFISEMHRLHVTDRQSTYFDLTPLAKAEHDRKRCRDELESCIQKDKKLTKLCRIARKGDFAKLKTHVERKPEDVLYLSEGDRTYPIYWACVANSKPCIDYLIQNGANFDVSTKDGNATINGDVNAHINYTAKLLRTRHHLAAPDELAYIPKVYDDRKQAGISLLELTMHPSEVRTLQRMGFKRRTLKTVIKHQLEKTGKVLTSLLPYTYVMLYPS